MYTIRKTAGREAQIAELERRTGFAGVTAMFDYALKLALDHTEDCPRVNLISVSVGKTRINQSGHYTDNTHRVEFVGEEIGRLESPKSGTNGIDQVLYRTADGRLVVHEYSWTKWQPGSDLYKLHQVERDDLEPGGQFEELGRESYFRRAMSFDEALARPE